MAMTFGIHIGHMGGPLDEMRKHYETLAQRSRDRRDKRKPGQGQQDRL